MNPIHRDENAARTLGIIRSYPSSVVAWMLQSDERKILDQMRQLRARPRSERLSYEAIAEQLNAQGYTTRYGRPWTRAGIY